MINVAEITSTKGVEQAKKKMEQAKNRMALEKKKANEERRKFENHHKYMIDENGKWMPKQKKIYILDKNGNKIRTKKGYKSKTEKTTDWDEPSNAKMWRKNLAELINETNSDLKIEEQWEHKSFKELGIVAPPTIHLGSKANALEKKGIHTERGDYNRRVLEIRGLIDFIAKTSASIEAFVSKNEVHQGQSCFHCCHPYRSGPHT